MFDEVSIANFALCNALCIEQRPNFVNCSMQGALPIAGLTDLRALDLSGNMLISDKFITALANGCQDITSLKCMMVGINRDCIKSTVKSFFSVHAFFLLKCVVYAFT